MKEARINVDPHIRTWLASMGYPVNGWPQDAVARVFVQEAQQWELAPERLAEMIRDARPPRERVPARVA